MRAQGKEVTWLKHEKDERSALFEYLDDNDCTIYSYGEAQNEVHELETILEGLQKYDSPDMYAIVGNMLVIIEHFAFDASRETKRKGMERIRKDREAHAKMWADVMNGNIPAVIVTQARETLSLHTWQFISKIYCCHFAYRCNDTCENMNTQGRILKFSGYAASTAQKVQSGNAPIFLNTYF